jgi:hypothetical protein
MLLEYMMKNFSSYKMEKFIFKSGIGFFPIKLEKNYRSVYKSQFFKEINQFYFFKPMDYG